MIKKILELYKKNKEIINYLIFGVLTTIVALGTYVICASTFLDVSNPFELQIANIISWILALVFAYLTNRKYVFESNNPNKIKEFIKFTSSRLTTLILDMLIMFLGVTLLKYNDKIVKIISQIFVILGNYIFSKLFVFKKTDKI